MKFKRISRNKKGVELSMNTIIVAAIALVVFIVLVIVLTGNTGKVFGGLKSCDAIGGHQAKDVAECTERGGLVLNSEYYYEKDGEIQKDKADNVCCSKDK